jgi:hypothetical protein
MRLILHAGSSFCASWGAGAEYLTSPRFRVVILTGFEDGAQRSGAAVLGGDHAVDNSWLPGFAGAGGRESHGL